MRKVGVGNDNLSISSQLKYYYYNIFPHEEIFNALDISSNKEIALEKEDGSFIRYESYQDSSDMKQSFWKKMFCKVHVGSVYDSKPGRISSAEIIGKELVFDLDLTDYPRTCCSGKKICESCYEIIKCSVVLFDYILREEFGFDEFGFVFSGRRGLHVWVLGNNELDNHTRLSIYRYFQNLIDKSIKIKEYDEIINDFLSVSPMKGKPTTLFYPRLDMQVTVNNKHLIKIPLSVHTDTLNISIPLDPRNIKNLNEIPTLHDMINDPQMMDEYRRVIDNWRLK